MAIIKCPECGRQISDKAPACPNCGVEIAGKITKCTQCGEIYFREQHFCPNCHHAAPAGTPASTTGVTPPPVPQQREQEPQRREQEPQHADKPQHSEKKPQAGQPHKSHTALIVAFVIALAICATCFYFYSNAKSDKELEAYEFALKSDDPLVLQTYLDNNADAPADHIQAINAKLEQLKQQDNEWTNVVVSGSKAALQDFLAKHPDTDHKNEIMHKIDSIDWADASKKNTLEALQTYLDTHEEGEHFDDAQTALKALKAKTVGADEKTLVAAVCKHFFQAINAKSDVDLEATVAPILTNFLGKTDAIKADVVTFMHKIYKDDITRMTWHLNNDYEIEKKEVGDEEYEYSVTVSALQDIERTDDTKEKHVRYRISATINPDGLISAMSMTKILE